MEAKDGSFGFDLEATYDEVTPQKSMTYTIPDFEAQPDKTKVTTVFDAETVHPVEYQKSGWQSILNSFKK